MLYESWLHGDIQLIHYLKFGYQNILHESWLHGDIQLIYFETSVIRIYYMNHGYMVIFN